MVPNRAASDRVWQPLPAGASSFDPGSGAVYYPGMSQISLTTTDPATGKQVVVYYTVPGALAASDPAYYRAILAQAVANATRAAQAEQAAAEPPGAPAGPAAPASRGFRSRFAGMLGGSEDVPLRFAVGEARLGQGKPAEAALAFQECIAASGGDPTPLLAHAVALLAHGDHAGAADSLRPGLERLADWDSLRVNWPTVLGGDEKTISVEDGLRRTLAAEPAGADAALLLAFFLFAARQDEMVAGVLQEVGDAGDPLLKRLQSVAAHRASIQAEGAAAVRPAQAP